MNGVRSAAEGPRSAESESRASEAGAPSDAPEGRDVDTAEAPVRASLSLRTVKEVVRGIPRFGVLLFRLLGDGRVSLVDRALFGFALAYLFTPVDLVPDFILGFGELDDLLVLFMAIDRLMNRTDREVLLDHWDGDQRPLLVVTDLLDRVTGRLPRWLRRVLRAG